MQHLFVFLIIKVNEMHYFSHLFDKVLYMFRTSPLSIIRSISTLYTQQYVYNESQRDALFLGFI